MDPKSIEASLAIKLPIEYLNFKKGKEEQAQFLPSFMNKWRLWPLSKALEKTVALRGEGALGDRDFAIADDGNDCILFYENSQADAKLLKLLDKERNVFIHSFGLSEFVHHALTQKLIAEIETGDWKKQDLSAIQNCPGSLYEYALKLNTHESEENFSPERNEKARELFLRAADAGHPSAATELADYYFFLDEEDLEQVIFWRERAIAFGSRDDLYKLADYLIDNKPERVDRAVALLISLLDDPWRQEHAMNFLVRIYRKSVLGQLPVKKHISLAQALYEKGDGRAFPDMAFFYFFGMGTPRDVQKGYDLLLKAQMSHKEASWGPLLRYFGEVLAAR